LLVLDSLDDRLFKKLEYERNNTSRLKCRDVLDFKPNGLIKFHWFKDSMPIANDNSKYIIKKHQLIIKHLNDSDSGVYTCAVNYNGSLYKKTFVISVSEPLEQNETFEFSLYKKATGLESKSFKLYLNVTKSKFLCLFRTLLYQLE